MKLEKAIFFFFKKKKKKRRRRARRGGFFIRVSRAVPRPYLVQARPHQHSDQPECVEDIGMPISPAFGLRVQRSLSSYGAGDQPINPPGLPGPAEPARPPPSLPTYSLCGRICSKRTCSIKFCLKKKIFHMVEKVINHCTYIFQHRAGRGRFRTA